MLSFTLGVRIRGHLAQATLVFRASQVAKALALMVEWKYFCF